MQKRNDAAGNGMIQSRTFTYKTVLAMLLVALIPLGVLSGFIYHQQRFYVAKAIEENLYNLSTEIFLGIENSVDTSFYNLKTLAHNPALFMSDELPGGARRVLEEYQDFYHLFVDIVLLDTAGEVCVSSGTERTAAWGDKPWFQRALRGRPGMSPVQYRSESASFVYEIAIPVYDEERLVNVLGAAVNLERIAAVTERLEIGRAHV